MELCQYRQGKIDSIIDSLEREEKMDKFINEKMEFFNAVEEGEIVLGDTLLHLAVRRGHENIVFFLIEHNLREDIPNFDGQIVVQCCKTPALRVLIEDVQDAHAILGFDYGEIIKVYRMMKSLRRIFPLWMFGSEEADSLLRVIYGARSNHERYRRSNRSIVFDSYADMHQRA